MKSAAQRVRKQLLTLLSNGEFHSGEALAQTLNLSRTAVAGHISQLEQWGLNVFRVKGKGYRLDKPLTLLNAKSIRNAIEKPVIRANLDVAPILASSNATMKEHLKDYRNGDVLLAEIQTAGRGRHGREWVAPVGGSLTFSMYWRFDDGYQSMSGLSLLVGLAICQGLEKVGLDTAQLKWPNDVYVMGKKLAGVLVEVEGQIGAPAHCVIGIGINVDIPEDANDVGQPHTDVRTQLGREVNRNELAAAIIESLWFCLPKFAEGGFTPFIHEWVALDLYADKRVVLKMGEKRFTGINRGVDNSGALLVETVDGMTRFHGGEVSLRGH